MSILDQYGRPIEPVRRPVTDRVAVAPVWAQWSSYPSRGLTPERLTAILTEADEGNVARQCELAMEMEEKDAHLASQLQLRKSAVAGLSREVIPADDSDLAAQAAELCEAALARLDMDDLIVDMMDAVFKGWSASEIIWETGSRAMPRAVEWIEPQRFHWDRYNIRLLTDDEPVRGVSLPPYKFVLHVAKARSGLPARGGLFRTTAWLYLFKNFAVKDWSAFLEGFGMPIRLGKYAPGTAKEDVDRLLAALISIASNAAGVIPSNADIQFVDAAGKSGGGSGGDPFERMAAWCERGLSKAILGQTLATDTSGGTGTLAAAEAHNDVRHDLTVSDAAALAKTVRRDLFVPVVGFNLGWDVAERLAPWLQFDVTLPEDDEATARTYGILVKEVGLRIGAAHVRDRFGIPAPKADEELVGAPAPKGGAEPLTLRQAHRADAAVATTAEEQDRVDELGDDAIAEGRQVFDQVLDPLLAVVDEATDLDDLRERVMAYGAGLSSQELQDLLARAMFMAVMGGKASV